MALETIQHKELMPPIYFEKREQLIKSAATAKRRARFAGCLTILCLVLYLVLRITDYSLSHSVFVNKTIGTIQSFWIQSTKVNSDIYINIAVDYPVSKEGAKVSSTNASQPSGCSAIPVEARFDCYPGSFDRQLGQNACLIKGCCWDDTVKKGAPYCFYPGDFPSYNINSKGPTSLGYRLSMSRNSPSKWPNDVKVLAVDVIYETDNRIHFRIFDPANKRYEVPIDVPNVGTHASNPNYAVDIPNVGERFDIRVKRKDSGNLVFDTSNGVPLIFSDQYIQISTQLGSKYLYGLGEHEAGFLLSVERGKMSFWARDQFPTTNVNLYGDHPFYMSLDKDGMAYGVFLLNSNAMEVELQPMPALTYRTIGGILDFYVFMGPTPNDVITQYTSVIGKTTMPPYWALGFHLCRYGYKSSEELKKVIERTRATKIPYVELQPMPALTYRTIGGILDFYVFMGPTPNDVIAQYTSVIGKPTMPPYWALGFHLCRWGYNSGQKLRKVIERTRATKIPYDTQWSDIDYMQSFLDWTYNHTAYSELPAIVQDLHNQGQHYIMIVDPGISNVQPPGSYPPYDEGLKQGVFIQKADKSGPIIGKVWPGETAFPDFFHPAAQDWWYRQADRYHSQVPFDGMWIDMNEPSNFVQGSMEGCPGNSSLDNPPWIPVVDGFSLASKTVCPSALHSLSSHYNLHSLYGFSESRVSNRVLEKLLGERSVVISRSSFPSSGRYAGHWTGDIISQWSDLYYSIPQILNFQLFGIPFVGADICGFQRPTTPELCARWMQLGSFYPFMRNHNSLGEPDQDPGVFDNATQDAMRRAVVARYTLLPFLYTLFHNSHINGSAVARPLMFEFPSSQTYGIDKQFLWGSSLLISPVLTQGARSVNAFLPKGNWYDYYTGAQIRGQNGYVNLSAPYNHINLHLREGSIIPTQTPNVTTTLARRQKFGVLVSLTDSGQAVGNLFLDDGVALDSMSSGKFSFFSFKAMNNKLTISTVKSGYVPPTGAILGNCRVMGISFQPTSVTANGMMVPFNFNTQDKVLNVEGLALNMMKTITLTWSN